MLVDKCTGKSCYGNFFKLKHKSMLGKFHVSRGHVRRGLPVVLKPLQLDLSKFYENLLLCNGISEILFLIFIVIFVCL